MPPYRPIDIATVYVSMFPARTDVYAEWTDDGWRPVRHELTAQRAYDALTKKAPSVSGYMIAPGSRSHSFALDFDSESGADQATTIGRAAWEQGIPVYVEPSRRGAHLWGVLEVVAPARAIRNALRTLIRDAGHDPEDPKIELRPGSDTVDAEYDDGGNVIGTGLGHAIRLPFMPHPKTGIGGRLVDPVSSEPIGSSIGESLLNFQLVPWDWFADAAMRWAPKPSPLRVSAWLRKPKAPLPEDDGSASDLLRELWGCQNAAPGRTVRCPAHDDKKSSLNILRDDKRAICMASGCVLNNDDRGRGTWELRHMAPRQVS